ncbi:MAG: hypothetical protein IJP29_07620 [Lachnospiraceae bacterium]|nr:hypothetical protein [Lachnospiraceae bacterium]
MKNLRDKRWGMRGKLWFVICMLLCAFCLAPSITAEAKWVKVGENYRYTTNEAGTKYYKNCWKKINGKYYYFNKRGYRKTGWFKYDGKKYYLNKKGVRVTGMKTIKNKKYYFSKKGILITGWIKYKNHYYYANNKGVIMTGVQSIDQKIYYFDKSGKRVVNANVVIGNMTYYFAANGVLQYTGTEMEKAVKYINIQRVLNGYEPLTYYINCNLSAAAGLRAQELSVLQSHTRPDGTNYSTVIATTYPVNTYWSGECVSWGKAKSGDTVAANWMADNNSKVLLAKQANAISIGTYTDEKGCEYWVALVVQAK